MRGSCGRRGSSPARAARPKAEERRLTANTRTQTEDRLVTGRTRPFKGGQHANPTQESRSMCVGSYTETGTLPRVFSVGTQA